MRKRQIFLYILIAIVLAAIALFLIRTIPGSDIDTVPVVLPSAAPNDGSDLAEPSPEPTQSAITVDADTVQSALRTLSRADSYSRTITAESFWSGGSSSQSIEVAVRSGSTRLTVSAEGAPTKNILIADGEKWIWYSDSDQVFHGDAAAADADQYQTLLSYEDILELDRNCILEASYDQFDGRMCIFVRYTSGSFGYESRAHIDVASGLLISLETYDEGRLIYRMVSSQPDLSTPDESVFVHP